MNRRDKLESKQKDLQGYSENMVNIMNLILDGTDWYIMTINERNRIIVSYKGYNRKMTIDPINMYFTDGRLEFVTLADMRLLMNAVETVLDSEL